MEIPAEVIIDFVWERGIEKRIRLISLDEKKKYQLYTSMTKGNFWHDRVCRSADMGPEATTSVANRNSKGKYTMEDVDLSST